MLASSPRGTPLDGELDLLNDGQSPDSMANNASGLMHQSVNGKSPLRLHTFNLRGAPSEISTRAGRDDSMRQPLISSLSGGTSEGDESELKYTQLHAQPPLRRGATADSMASYRSATTADNNDA